MIEAGRGPPHGGWLDGGSLAVGIVRTRNGYRPCTTTGEGAGDDRHNGIQLGVFVVPAVLARAFRQTGRRRHDPPHRLDAQLPPAV